MNLTALIAVLLVAPLGAQTDAGFRTEELAAPALLSLLHPDRLHIEGVPFAGPPRASAREGDRGFGLWGQFSGIGDSFVEVRDEAPVPVSGIEHDRFWSLFFVSEEPRGDIRFDRERGRLRISGSKSTRDETKRFLRGLSKSLAPRIRVALLRVQVTGAPIAIGRLRAAAARSLRERVRNEQGLVVRWQHEQAVVAGETLALTRQKPSYFLVDQNVEISQAASCADPVVKDLPLGWRSRLQFYPSLDEAGAGLVLAGLLHRSRSERGPKKVDLNVDKIDFLESLEVQSCESLFSLPLGTGEAVSFDVSTGGEARELLLIFPEHEAAPRQRDWRADGTEMHFLAHPWLGGEALRPEDDPGLARLPSDRVPDRELARELRNELDPAVRDLELVDCSERLTVIRGRPELTARFVEEHRSRIAPYYRGVSVRIRQERRAGTGSPARWEATGEELTLHVAPGRYACAHRGASQSYVADWNVEASGTERIADPDVAGCFSGISAVATLRGSGDAAEPFELHLRFLEQRLRDFRVLASSAETVGKTWLPRLERVRIQRALRFSNGEPQLVCEGVPELANGASVRTRWRATLVTGDR